ncbi:MAG TPA: helicase HerA-like domain-containing protein [Candidatus Binatia bacterium]
MSDEASILVGKSLEGSPQRLLARMANRHGLVAGATGTGKTVTLQLLAESFSRLGVPVFAADVKGDLAGISQPGGGNPKIAARAAELGLGELAYEGSPTTFWDVFGELGHPVRTTVSEMGPLLLARLLDLNETQAGVLSVVFRVADDEGLLLLDLKDLRAMLTDVAARAKELNVAYGHVSAASVGAIQRALLALEEQGGNHLFGEPALDIHDLIRTVDGRGVVNVLAAEKLFHAPKLYATFLLWLLSEIFEQLPEVGDLDRPKLVFFFDEAHLLFDDAPDALRDKIEQVVRLVRSKGVGVYLVTQHPTDVPDAVLAQLGNRVQHALRAFTPRDQKAVRAAASTFRANPGVDVERAIVELGVGEALVSFLDGKGMPTPVERALICPPTSRIGTITADERARIVQASPLRGRYERVIDRESAYEMLRARAEQAREDGEDARGTAGGARRDDARSGRGGGGRSSGRRRDSVGEAMLKSAARSIGTAVGRELGGSLGARILRGVLGSLLGGRR